MLKVGMGTVLHNEARTGTQRYSTHNQLRAANTKVTYPQLLPG